MLAVSCSPDSVTTLHLLVTLSQVLARILSPNLMFGVTPNLKSKHSSSASLWSRIITFLLAAL